MMTRLRWDVEKNTEQGVDHCVLYSQSGLSNPWSGLKSITEMPIIGSETVKYLNGDKSVNKLSVDEFAAEIEAYTYPEELNTLQKFSAFAYRTKISESNYRIHIVYNPIFVFDDILYNSINDSVELTTFKINVSSTPMVVNGYAPTSQLTIDIFGLESHFIEYFEDKLYGSLDAEPLLLQPNDIILIASELELFRTLIIIDKGDGSWTAIGPDDIITMTDNTSFEITAPSAIFIDSESYTLTSM